jgi:hypothetical protein
MGRMLKNMATSYTCEVFLLKYKEWATRTCPITLVQTPMSRNKGKKRRRRRRSGSGAAGRGVAWRGLAWLGLAWLKNKPKLNKKVPTRRTLGARRGGSLNLPGPASKTRQTVGRWGQNKPCVNIAWP